MSRIGNKPVIVPSGVTVKIEPTLVTVVGPLGTLKMDYNPLITIKQDGDHIHLTRADEEKHTKQLHGTTRANLHNMVEGVTKGYTKELEIKGIGYHAQMKGNDVTLLVGYSHPVVIKALPNTKISVNKETTGITISGTDKQAVGQVANLIRQVRQPEPYLGKGIAYKGEHIRRKEGKKAGK
ncbi:MAG: 50S ribosomal protein L6 [Bacilli bacterium]|jgi:large subunit ribosomal protein L6